MKDGDRPQGPLGSGVSHGLESYSVWRRLYRFGAKRRSVA